MSDNTWQHNDHLRKRKDDKSLWQIFEPKMSQGECGAILGLSQQRVQQIERQALLKIRRRMLAIRKEILK